MMRKTDSLSAEFVAEGVHGGPGDMDGQLCDLQQGIQYNEFATT